jgi:curved DNA-binding protein CbpA
VSIPQGPIAEHDFIDYYALLGVPFGCTTDQIEAACLALGQRHRPDRENASESDKRMFILIDRAYETLRDPEQRESYDRRYLDHLIAKDGQEPPQSSARRPAHQTEGIWTIAAAVVLPILSALVLEIDYWARDDLGFFATLYYTDFHAFGYWIEFNALQLLLVSLLLNTWGGLTLLRVASGPWSTIDRIRRWFRKQN